MTSPDNQIKRLARFIADYWATHEGADFPLFDMAACSPILLKELAHAMEEIEDVRNAIRSEENAGYQAFPFLTDHVRQRMKRSPRRHGHLIDRARITFCEAMTADGRRYIRHSSYPGLDDVSINAEPNTDPEFLREYAAYAFAAQLTQMSGHELAEIISRISCYDV